VGRYLAVATVNVIQPYSFLSIRIHTYSCLDSWIQRKYSPRMLTKPIAYDTFQELLREEFGGVIHIFDKDYAFASEEYLLACAKRLIKSNKQEGITFGKKWDCDNFTVDFVNLVSKNHARTQSSIDAQGLAVGGITYRDPNLGMHMIVWFLVPDKEFKFIEPQTGNLIELSQEQKDNACYVFV
jgi:hypothetical protein